MKILGITGGSGSGKTTLLRAVEHLGGSTKLSFEEGVDSYVPYAGPLADGVQTTLYKVIGSVTFKIF